MADTAVEDDAPTRSRRDDKERGLSIVGKSILINRPRDELFAFWQNFSNLAQFMENLERVETLDDGVSRWTIKAPMGRDVSILTKIESSVANQSIAWVSTEKSEIKTRGRVDFSEATGGRGTVVTLDIAYDPPGGDLGRLVAKLFMREPNIQARQELKRFKMLMEAGELAVGPDQLNKQD